MNERLYPFVVQALSVEDGGGFVAYAIDLVGCMADGDSPDQAAQAIQDAIGEWCDEARRLGRDIPEPGSAFERAKTERDALFGIIRQQTDLLQIQGAAIADLDQRLNHLSAAVDDLASRDAPYFVASLWYKGRVSAPTRKQPKVRTAAH